ncbi:hypothetical protein [Enterococcus italicus]|uniref:hypothetical protein n=1 Tax=Enterococcus italicus TaxID=246144 RepID=UPI003F45D72C
MISREKNDSKKKYNLFLSVTMIICCIIPFLSTEIGVGKEGFKIGISDFLIIIYFFIWLFEHKGVIKFDSQMPEFRGMFLCLMYLIFFIPIGLLNGALIPEVVRLIRNLMYIFFTYYILRRDFDPKRVNILIMLISIVISINTLINAIILFHQNDWFKFYRANGLLTVMLFCYIFFAPIKNKVLKIVLLLLLLSASMLSQERTQLLAEFLTIIVMSVIKICVPTERFNINKLVLHTINFFIILLISYAIVFFVLKIQFFREYLDYFYKYRFSSGTLLSNNSLAADGSFKARIFQITTIFNDINNIFYFLFGKGTNAHYMTFTGETYIVDGTYLWVFKDLGVVGFILFLSPIYKGMKTIPKATNNSNAIRAAFISFIIFMISNPTILISASNSFALGLFLYVKKVNQIEKNS